MPRVVLMVAGVALIAPGCGDDERTSTTSVPAKPTARRAFIASPETGAHGKVRVELADDPVARVVVHDLRRRDARAFRAWILWLITERDRGYTVGPLLNNKAGGSRSFSTRADLAWKSRFSGRVAARAEEVAVTLAGVDAVRRAVLATRFGSATHPFRVRGREVAAGEFQQ